MNAKVLNGIISFLIAGAISCTITIFIFNPLLYKEEVGFLIPVGADIASIIVGLALYGLLFVLFYNSNMFLKGI